MIEKIGLDYKMEYVILVTLSLIGITGNESIDAREVIHRYEVPQELFQAELARCEERAEKQTNKLILPDGRIVALIYCTGGPK